MSPRVPMFADASFAICVLFMSLCKNQKRKLHVLVLLKTHQKLHTSLNMLLVNFWYVLLARDSIVCDRNDWPVSLLSVCLPVLSVHSRHGANYNIISLSLSLSLFPLFFSLLHFSSWYRKNISPQHLANSTRRPKQESKCELV
jgi:hypothetical protein